MPKAPHRKDPDLRRTVDRASDDCAKTVGAESPADTERTLRDILATLITVAATNQGEQVDLDFMFADEPDGSRIAPLEKLIEKVLHFSDPAYALAHDASLTDQIVADCAALGIVGERDLVLAIYLIGTSRLLAQPLSAIVQGASSSGKSYIVNQIARLFPAAAVLHATRITPQALYHMSTVSHRFVVGGERSRVHDDAAADATGALRQLLSEGRITKLITERDKDGKHTTRTVAQDGPIAYIETTTLRPGYIFAEDLNRGLLLTTDTSERHTRAILAKAAGKYTAGQSADIKGIIEKHHVLQANLKRLPVCIPFATQLVAAMPTRKVEARRVGQQVLSMIEASTILHQYQRKQDDLGRLIAEARDYEIARQVLLQPLGESLGVKPAAAKFCETLRCNYRREKRQFSTADAQKLDLKTGTRTVRGWLQELAEHGCIRLVEASKGPKPAIWRLTGTVPSDTVLPLPAKIGLPG